MLTTILILVILTGAVIIMQLSDLQAKSRATNTKLGAVENALTALESRLEHSPSDQAIVDEVGATLDDVNTRLDAAAARVAAIAPTP